MKKFALLLTLSLGLASVDARDEIRIVGSSTVYPFSSSIAEEFGETTDFKAPVVESTGSGGGQKLFYGGIGDEHPDITNSSRRMKSSELETNLKAGIQPIEIMIGYDGIAVAQNKSNDPINLTIKQLTLAVAEKIPDGKGGFKKNDNKTWKDIDASLPDRKILILGPPTTSGTRDAFNELVIREGAAELGYPDAMDGKEDGKIKYQSIRQDGVWVDSGENDNLIVQKLSNDKNAVGVFGYSFLEENRDKISAATVNGVEPGMDTISSGDYPISRSLFFYVKKNHIGKVKGLEQFVDLFLSEDMIGADGVQKDLGLVPLPKADLDKIRANWKARKVMTLTDLAEK